MKQINIISSRFGTEISTESFIIDGTDCFIQDVIYQYVSLKNDNNKLNNSDIRLNYEIIDIKSINRYDFFNKIKERMFFEQSVNDKLKARLEKLQKHANKHCKK